MSLCPKSVQLRAFGDPLLKATPIGWRAAFSGPGRGLGRALGAFLICALGLIAGCGKSGIEGELQHFREAGHAVAAFADSDPGGFGAKKCQSGTLDQLPVLFCEFGSSDAAAKSQPAAERWGGDVGTVVILRRGPLLFAAADRKHADPNGKTLSALAKVFRRAKNR